jgi:hypothetical protein
MQGQLAESGRSSWQPGVPPFTDLLLPMGSVNTGLLANAYTQTTSASFIDVGAVIITYRTILGGAESNTNPLAVLKRQKFTAERQQARIEASLAALNAPQPTELSTAQWKALLEEVEDED